LILVQEDEIAGLDGVRILQLAELHNRTNMERKHGIFVTCMEGNVSDSCHAKSKTIQRTVARTQSKLESTQMLSNSPQRPWHP
jgi:hypothetical protein